MTGLKFSTLKYFVLAFVLVVLLPTVHQAQNTKKFRGPYTFYGIDGAAQYEYLQVKRDSTVKEGKFDFSQKYTDSLDTQVFYKFQVSGQYLQDKKVGTWQFIDARHVVTVKDVAFFNVKASLDSELRETTAGYNQQGLPEGPWNYRVLRYKDEKIIDLLVSKNLTFTNGHLSGPFSFNSDESEGYFGLYSINGRCTGSGLMDSLWTFEYMRDSLKILEHRYYDDGFLVEVAKLTNNGDRDTLFSQRYKETASKLNIIKNGGTSLFKVSERDFDLDYIAAFDVTDKRYLTQTHANGYLKEIMEDLTLFSTEDYYQDGLAVLYPIKTKRFEFAITASDDSVRKELAVKYKELLEVIAAATGSTTIDLNKRRTDTLYFANVYVDMLDSLLWRLSYPIGRIISDEFKYFDTDGYSKSHPFDFMNTDSLVVNTGDSTFVIQYNFNAGLDDAESLVERMYHYIDQMNGQASRYLAVINDQLAQLQIGDDLAALQIEIVDKHQALLSQFKRINYYSKEERELYRAVRKTFLEDQFEQFATAYSRDDFEAGKVDKANEYMEILDNLGDQIRPLGSVYRNQSILDSLYQEEVFNPFTYTSYSRRVKEDVFNKGNQLFAHYVDALKSATSYSEITYWLGRIEKLQNKLEQLRNEDTRGLERNLRGKKSIAEIISLFNLTPETKEAHG